MDDTNPKKEVLKGSSNDDLDILKGLQLDESQEIEIDITTEEIDDIIQNG